MASGRPQLPQSQQMAGSLDTFGERVRQQSAVPRLHNVPGATKGTRRTVDTIHEAAFKRQAPPISSNTSDEQRIQWHAMTFNDIQ